MEEVSYKGAQLHESLTIQSHKYLLNGKDRERPGRNKVGTIAAG